MAFFILTGLHQKWKKWRKERGLSYFPIKTNTLTHNQGDADNDFSKQATALTVTYIGHMTLEKDNEDESEMMDDKIQEIQEEGSSELNHQAIPYFEPYSIALTATHVAVLWWKSMERKIIVLVFTSFYCMLPKC